MFPGLEPRLSGAFIRVAQSRSAAVSPILRCAILSDRRTGGTGIETTRVHYTARRRGSSVAARGARAAVGDAGGWPSPQHVSFANTTQLVIPSARTEASRLWPK